MGICKAGGHRGPAGTERDTLYKHTEFINTCRVPCAHHGLDKSPSPPSLESAILTHSETADRDSHLKQTSLCFHLSHGTILYPQSSGTVTSSHQTPAALTDPTAWVRRWETEAQKGRGTAPTLSNKDKSFLFRAALALGITVILYQLLLYRDLYEIISIPLK